MNDINDINAILAMLGGAEVGVWSLIVMIVLSLPPVFVLFSKRVSGSTKILWFILTSIFSWLAYAVFLYLTRKKVSGDSQAGKASD
jgi:phosphotransferase system  glucose/maltose/N-acetylglucosamine-specific IIC component